MARSFCGQVDRERAQSAEGCYESLGERISFLYADPRETDQGCAGARQPRLVEACLRGAGRR
jgi:hypothetical protein